MFWYDSLLFCRQCKDSTSSRRQFSAQYFYVDKQLLLRLCRAEWLFFESRLYWRMALNIYSGLCGYIIFRRHLRLRGSDGKGPITFGLHPRLSHGQKCPARRFRMLSAHKRLKDQISKSQAAAGASWASEYDRRSDTTNGYSVAILWWSDTLSFSWGLPQFGITDIRKRKKY